MPRCVPRFRFARIASITAAGLRREIHSPFGSASTGICPASITRPASSAVRIRTAVMSSTCAVPWNTASLTATARRMAAGFSVSSTRSRKPLFHSR